MSRPLRIEFAGALYHVTSCGDGREVIFLDDEDRQGFLDVLSELVRDFNWAVHAYCLLDNHYHLLIETPESNLSRGMRQLNGVYTQRFNRRHGRVGLQGDHRAEGIVLAGIGASCRPQSGQGTDGTHARPMAMEQLSGHGGAVCGLVLADDRLASGCLF